MDAIKIVVEVNTDETGQVVRVYCSEPNADVAIFDLTQMTAEIMHTSPEKANNARYEAELRLDRAATGLIEK